MQVLHVLIITKKLNPQKKNPIYSIHSIVVLSFCASGASDATRASGLMTLVVQVV
jgi:hypothetical protein